MADTILTLKLALGKRTSGASSTPLSGSNTWVEYEGTSVVRKVWNGHANLIELEVDGPAGHIEGLNLRLYNS